MSLNCQITGVGSYSPELRPGRADFPGAHGNDVAEFRHHAGTHETSVAMGIAAARAALDNAGLAPSELDGAIVWSGMPDYEVPKDGSAIMHALGATRAVCWHIDTACASFITGLEAARLRIAGGGARNVLVLMIMNWVNRAVDRTLDYSSVGDGAAAVVLSDDPQGSVSFLGIREATHGEHFGYLELRSPFAETDGATTDRLPVIEFGSDPAHGGFLMSGCLESARELLRETGTEPGDIDWFVAHQPGTRLPRIWARALGIPPEKVLSSYDTHANMSAVNIPMTLARFAGGRCLHGADVIDSASAALRIKRGQRILFFAPGAGLHVAAMLWIW